MITVAGDFVVRSMETILGEFISVSKYRAASSVSLSLGVVHALVVRSNGCSSVITLKFGTGLSGMVSMVSTLIVSLALSLMGLVATVYSGGEAVIRVCGMEGIPVGVRFCGVIFLPFLLGFSGLKSSSS